MHQDLTIKKSLFSLHCPLSFRGILHAGFRLQQVTCLLPYKAANVI